MCRVKHNSNAYSQWLWLQRNWNRCTYRTVNPGLPSRSVPSLFRPERSTRIMGTDWRRRRLTLELLSNYWIAFVTLHTIPAAFGPLWKLGLVDSVPELLLFEKTLPLKERKKEKKFDWLCVAAAASKERRRNRRLKIQVFSGSRTVEPVLTSFRRN